MFMYFIAQFLTCRGPINKGKQKDMQWWTFWKQRYTSLRLFISENNPKLSICYIQCIYLQSFSIYIYSFILFFSHPRKFRYGNKKDSADKVAEGLLEYVFDQSMALLYLAEASIDWQQSSATTTTNYSAFISSQFIHLSEWFYQIKIMVYMENYFLYIGLLSHRFNNSYTCILSSYQNYQFQGLS